MWLVFVVPRSVVDPSRIYPFTVSKKSIDNPSLVIDNAALDIDDLQALEFELHVGFANRHCTVFADLATESQGELLKPFQKDTTPLFAAQSRAARAERPVIFVHVNVKTHDMEHTVFLIDKYIIHHTLLGMDRLIIYILERIVLLTEHPIIKVRM